MRLALTFLAVALAASIKLNGAEPSPLVVHYSPDKSAFIAWSDYDAGRPLGMIRSIVLRQSNDEWVSFGLVTTPRTTDAAWNAASTRCLLSDAPDNGNLFVWLIEKNSEAPTWRPVSLNPLATVERQFHTTDHGSSLWRPSVLKMSWTDDTSIELRCYCNLGTYLITVDTRKTTGPFHVKKLSNKLLDE